MIQLEEVSKAGGKVSSIDNGNDRGNEKRVNEAQVPTRKALKLSRENLLHSLANCVVLYHS